MGSPISVAKELRYSNLELETQPVESGAAPIVSTSALRLPKVSVVMPIRNEEEFIADTIGQVLGQEAAWMEESDGHQLQRQIEFEILVVDGCSTDQTTAIVSSIADQDDRVRLLNNPGRLSSSARNIGVENSTGDYVVIIDGHCEIPSTTYLTDLVRAFERTQADCLGRPQPLDVTDATLLQQAIAAARNTALGHHPDSFIYSKQELPVPAISVAVAYRRDVFDRIGMFDTRFDACEDCELNHRIDQAGLKCFLVPDLTVRYQPRKSLSALFYQLKRYGRGRIRLFRKHFDAFSISAIIPALFVLGLIVGPILSLMFPVLWWVYFGTLAIYSSTVLYYSFKAASEARQSPLLKWLPLVFVTIHVGSGWGVLQQAFTSLFEFRDSRLTAQ